MARRKTILTTNKEIYSKMNMLKFSPEIVLRNASLNQINQILNNVNKNEKVLDCEKLGNYFLIKKNRPLNLSVYLNKRSKK